MKDLKNLVVALLVIVLLSTAFTVTYLLRIDKQVESLRTRIGMIENEGEAVEIYKIYPASRSDLWKRDTYFPS